MFSRTAVSLNTWSRPGWHEEFIGISTGASLTTRHGTLGGKRLYASLPAYFLTSRLHARFSHYFPIEQRTTFLDTALRWPQSAQGNSRINLNSCAFLRYV